MRAFFTRRVIIALVSGLLTLAIVVGIALTYDLRAVQRDSQAMATPTAHPYTYSVTVTPTTSPPAPTATPAPTKSKGGSTTSTSVSAPPTHGGRVASDTPTPTSSGGGSTSVGATPTATLTGPTATPIPLTPTATSIASTPTATPVPFDGASVVASSGWQYGSYGWITVPVTMTNTGTTTWSGPGIYHLDCLSTCLSASPVTTNGVTPGASYTFDPMFNVPWPFTSVTYHSVWSMSDAGVSFGQTVKITITPTTAIDLGVDPAPGCDSTGMSWALSGGAKCANGGLLLTTNSANEPQALMTSGPSGMDTSNYLATFDVSFSAVNQAWVRLAYYSGGNEQGMDVEPGGKYRTFSIYNGVESDGLWSTLSGLTSPNFSATIGSQSYGYVVYINYGYMGDGGSRVAAGMPIITVGGANGVDVTVTNAEIDKMVTATTKWSVQG